ncbi:MAG: ABC transporter ATP-binding protein [Gammaproteobacteria bacterium]|nr:ABC transporter ATP-binding protein [Gammaproteobacteria bacterium]
MSQQSPIIKISQLCKQVPSPEGTLTLLDHIEFSIFPGESVAIVGASGSGKTTLLGLMAGLDLPTSGTVMINNVDIYSLNEDHRADLRRDLIGFVFQSFHLLQNMTAIENVTLPLEMMGNKKAVKSACSVLERVGLGARLHHYPKQLSGGEQQRVAIARAFASQPKLLFADEPTGNLDRATGKKVIDLLFELNREQHTTLILVTHDEYLADRCGRKLELRAGVII